MNTGTMDISVPLAKETMAMPIPSVRPVEKVRNKNRITASAVMIKAKTYLRGKWSLSTPDRSLPKKLNRA